MRPDQLSRWTFNANTNSLGDEAHYTRVRDAWKPPGQLLMNGLKGKSQQNVNVRLATSLREKGGNTIYRPYEHDNREMHFWKVRTPEQHVLFIQEHDSFPWLWYQIGNEPALQTEGDVRGMSAWLAEWIKLSVPLGIRSVVYNPSVAGFQRFWIEKGWFDEFLLELVKVAHIEADGWPQVILGSHSTAYWMGVAALHCAGRNPADLIVPEKLRRETWPTRDQIFDADTGDNWIVFRDWWFVEHARLLQRKHQVNLNHDIRIIATEAGPENLPNIRTQFPDVEKKMDEVCGRMYRGARAAEGYYTWAFPGQSAAQSLCNDMAFIEEMAPDVYLMFAAFSWTWHNTHPEYWRRDYNWGELFEVQKLWPEMRAPSQDVAVPKPADMGKEEARWLDHGSAVNIRKGPGVNYEVVKAVGPNTTLTVWSQQKPVEGGQYLWVWVEYEQAAGWMALVGGKSFEQLFARFKEAPPSPPAEEMPVEETPDEAPDEQPNGTEKRLAVAAALRHLADVLEQWDGE